jgi:hypothetical protein
MDEPARISPFPYVEDESIGRNGSYLMENE